MTSLNTRADINQTAYDLVCHCFPTKDGFTRSGFIECLQESDTAYAAIVHIADKKGNRRTDSRYFVQKSENIRENNGWQVSPIGKPGTI